MKSGRCQSLKDSVGSYDTLDAGHRLVLLRELTQWRSFRRKAFFLWLVRRAQLCPDVPENFKRLRTERVNVYLAEIDF
jgi:hypothetical protein